MSFQLKAITWTSIRPAWQSDLFRRAFGRNGELTTSQDWNEIRGMVRAAIGLPLPNFEAVAPVRPSPSEFSGISSESKIVSLRSMTCGANISAVPDGRRLPFGHKGLTVIYGENGTGKSSFARVLKLACGARDIEDVIPDIFSPKDGRTASCEFTFALGSDKPATETWRADSGASKTLSAIAVFDTKCGRVTLEKDIQLRYAPYGADAFPRVARAQKAISDDLNSEKPKPTKPNIEFKNKFSKAAIYFDSIKPNTPSSDLNTKLAWSDARQKKLDDLRNLDSKSRESNIAAVIADSKKALKRIEDAIGHLRNLSASLSLENIGSYNDALSAMVKAQKEQQAHASIKLGEEPLHGAGSDTWKDLYKAARAYSKVANGEEGGRHFSDETRCVWCMQVLQPEAKSRLEKFDLFMDNSIARKVQESSNAKDEAKNKITDLFPWSDKLFEASMSDLQKQNPILYESIHTIFNSLLNKREEIIEIISANQKIDAATSHEIPESEISQWLITRKEEIQLLEASAKPEALAALRVELQEYEDAFLLCQYKTRLQDYLRDSGVLLLYEKGIQELSITGISRKES